jgi:mRNA interferase MazF
MTGYERGDVVLVPFPFSERPVAKRRPAVVVSSDAYHTASDDVVIAQITSKLAVAPRPGDHHIVAWQEAGLVTPSLARVKLATLHSALILRRLGTMPASDMRAIDRGLAVALGLGKSPREERHA